VGSYINFIARIYFNLFDLQPRSLYYKIKHHFRINRRIEIDSFLSWTGQEPGAFFRLKLPTRMRIVYTAAFQRQIMSVCAFNRHLFSTLISKFISGGFAEGRVGEMPQMAIFPVAPHT
jgi:hypothetical protein